MCPWIKWIKYTMPLIINAHHCAKIRINSLSFFENVHRFKLYNNIKYIYSGAKKAVLTYGEESCNNVAPSANRSVDPNGRYLLKCGICSDVFLTIHELSNHLKHCHYEIKVWSYQIYWNRWWSRDVARRGSASWSLFRVNADEGAEPRKKMKTQTASCW